MTFQDSTLEGVYDELRRRQTETGGLSLIEFDDEDYEILLTLAREVVKRYRYWWWDKQRKARVVFLAFACEYVRRKGHHEYISDLIFWEKFEATLGIGWMERRTLIADELLWQTYSEEGIEQQWGNVNRLIVRSLVSEIRDAPKVARRQFIAFFRWYYQNYAGSEVTSELIQAYEAETGSRLNVFEKAVPALDRDCQALARVIEYTIEHSLSLARSDLDAYRQQIVEALGEEYDPLRLSLLRDERTLRNLVIELENHRTPVQFLRELERQLVGTVQTPEGRQLPAHEARRRWRPTDLAFGCYWLDTINYRVVPLSWLQLETIARWPYKEIVPLRRKGFVGYKKRQPFDVKAGYRVFAGRRCFLPRNEVACIWAGTVPQGERLIIDGRLCRESAGFDWNASLRLGYNEDGMPVIVAAFDKLVVFRPDRGGSRLLIRTSQGYEQAGYLHQDGSRQFHRAITIPLDRFVEPVTVSIHLDDDELDDKTFTPEPAYLFSCQTHEHVRPGVALGLGEYQYYLFSALDEYPLVGEGVKVEPLETSFDPYTVYRIVWKDSEQPFSLAIGDLSWFIQQQSYFHIRIEPQPARGIVRLARNQIHCFSQAHLRVLTTLDLAATPITCKVLFSDELVAEARASECLHLHDGHDLYHFSEDFLNKLDTATHDHYGRYNLLFYEDERLLDQITLALVPELDIRFPDSEQLLPEDAAVEAKVFSPHLDLWDPATGKANSAATLQLRPKLSAESWMVKRPVKGIRRLVPQAVNVPVVFPRIGETVEITVRPRLFGFRLYHRGYETGRNGQTYARYWRTNELDYYALETAALYVFTGPNYEVTLRVGSTTGWSGEADSEGHLLIEGLGFLKPHCHQERVFVEVASAGLERGFFIRWTPLIHKMMIEQGRIHLCVSGPKNTGIILRFVELDEVIRIQQWIACEGESFEVSLDLPSTKTSLQSSYLVPLYQLTDGTLLPASQQWRVRVPGDTSAISEDWLRAGVGVSGEEILETFVTE
jgi:hypothetical protein